MSIYEPKTRIFLKKWFAGNIFVAGFFALLWLLLRSGTRPSRLAYPCQQAAITTASLAFGAPLVGALIAARFLAGRLIVNRRVLATAAVGLFATIGLWVFLPRSDASITSSSTYGLLPPAGYEAEVFHVKDCPPDPDGDRFPGLDTLLRLMGENGVKIYRSTTASPLAGPDGIIASDDVVVIKINYQWSARGGSNTDVLRGLIRSLVDHPDGFTGEIVVGENAQFAPIEGFDRAGNNAQDRALSPFKVVQGFRNQGHQVNLSNWGSFRGTRTVEGTPCDEGWGYVLTDRDGSTVSYPKFMTEDGTCVSLKNGVWDSHGGNWDRSRLKFINLPVLKPHGNTYGVTACVKNFMGVVSESLTDSHNGVRGGILGAVMAEITPPDLNILDCIWTYGFPGGGPGVGYNFCTRSDQLVASTDPIAADIWATTNILVPTFEANGYPGPWAHPNPDPADPDSIFRGYLDRSMEKLIAAGYSVTNDLDDIHVFTQSAAIRRPLPRRPSGRIMPQGPDSAKLLQR
jgi:hypothetical protein